MVDKERKIRGNGKNSEGKKESLVNNLNKNRNLIFAFSFVLVLVVVGVLYSFFGIGGLDDFNNDEDKEIESNFDLNLSYKGNGTFVFGEGKREDFFRNLPSLEEESKKSDPLQDKSEEFDSSLKKKGIEDIKKEFSSKEKVRVLVKHSSIKEKDSFSNDSRVRETKEFVSLELNQSSLEERISEGELEEDSLFLDYSFEAFLDDSINLTGIYSLKEDGFGGDGIDVCLIDTGVNEEIVGTEVLGYNVFDGSNNISSSFEHGTLMAKIIHDISPDSKILMAKVFDDSGVAYASDVLSGLEWCEEQNPDIISFSIGGGLFQGYCVEDPVAQKVTELFENGTIVVAAAGNGGNYGLASPACAEKVISVGSAEKAESLSLNSNYHESLDFIVPGEDILIEFSSLEGPIYRSGTSISASIFSGGSALLLENNSLNSLELERGLSQLDDFTFVHFNNYTEKDINISSELEINFVNGSSDSFSTASSCSSLSGNVFQVKNSAGSVCFEINESGYASFFGTVETDCSSSSLGDVFKISDTGGTYFWINDSCYACLKGSVIEEQTLTYNSSQIGQLFVQDSSDLGLAKLNTDGNFFFKESVCGVCSGVGDSCSTGSECCSGYCYVDSDGDRYSPSSGGTKTCRSSSQLSGTDCCDSDSRVFPGQTSYYGTESDCGGYDFNCDGSVTKWARTCEEITDITLSDPFSGACGTGYATATASGVFHNCGDTVSPYSGIAFYYDDSCGCWDNRYIILESGTYSANSYVQDLGGFCSTTLQYSTTCSCR